jgi:hypothetical protein
MGYVKLLGLSTLPCGCVLGRYRDLSAGRDLAYVEQKGSDCRSRRHRRNRTLRPETLSRPAMGSEQAPRATVLGLVSLVAGEPRSPVGQ